MTADTATRAPRGRLLPTLALLDDARPVGRPRGQVGEVAQALLDAIERLSTPQRAPTVVELAHAAQVGRLAAKRTLDNLVRAGSVCIVRRRWVVYRTSPVAEYGVACPDAQAADAERKAAAEAERQAGAARLAQAMQAMQAMQATAR